MNNQVDYLKDIVDIKSKTAVILGSGLSQFSDQLSKKTIIPYLDIPNYIGTTIQGQVGEFVIGELKNIQIICARGRFHFYEGHSYSLVQQPIHLMKALGIENLIITNLSGCLKPNWELSDIMMITSHRDFTFRDGRIESPLIHGSPHYHSGMMQIARDVANSADINMREGQYVWTLGPTYETPAEIEVIRSLGGCAVGMSTVPEIEASRKLGLNMLGFATFGNYGAGMNNKKISHKEILDSSSKNQNRLSQLIIKLIPKL